MHSITSYEIRDIFLSLNDFSVYCNTSLINFCKIRDVRYLSRIEYTKNICWRISNQVKFVFLDRYRGKKSIMDKKCSAYHVGHLLWSIFIGCRNFKSCQNLHREIIWVFGKRDIFFWEILLHSFRNIFR